MDERVVYTQYWQIYSCTLLDNVFFIIVYFWQRGSETFHLLFCLFVYIVVFYIILQLTLNSQILPLTNFEKHVEIKEGNHLLG